MVKIGRMKGYAVENACLNRVTNPILDGLDLIKCGIDHEWWYASSSPTSIQLRVLSMKCRRKYRILF